MKKSGSFRNVFFSMVLVIAFLFSFAAYANTEDVAVVQDNANNILTNPKGGAATMRNATKEFYKTHQDEFDFLFVFLQTNSTANDEGYLPGAYVTSKAPSGTGAPAPAYTPISFGSSGKLKSVGDMYSITNYGTGFEDTSMGPATDPYLYYYGFNGLNTSKSGFTQTSMVLRAALKYWGAYLSTNGITGGNGYYSFYFNSNSSALGGHAISDFGGGEYRLTNNTAKKISNLDLYTMGFISKDEVTTGDYAQELFYLTGDSSHSIGEMPEDTVLVSNVQKIDITMDQIISANGLVNMDTAQKEFRCAFILVVPGGMSAMAADLTKIDKIRASFQDQFYNKTNKVGSMDCKLTDVEDGDIDKLCEDGDYACNEYVLLICNNEQWEFVEDCNNRDMFCSKEKGMCVEENDIDGDTSDNCSDGDTRCMGNVIELCENGSWTYNYDCANDEMVCYNALCMDESDIPDGDTGSDGDVVIDGDTTVDGDVIVDGDNNSCTLHTDCPSGMRCTSQGCLPCPTGQTFDLTTSSCEDIESAGGGCNATDSSSATFLLLLLAFGLMARRKFVKNN